MGYSNVKVCAITHNTACLRSADRAPPDCCVDDEVGHEEARDHEVVDLQHLFAQPEIDQPCGTGMAAEQSRMRSGRELRDMLYSCR